MNSYDTREMLAAIELRNPMKTFFADTLFKVHRTHIAEKIEVDVKKSRRRLAPFVAPRKGGKVLTRDGFKTNSITTPKLAPERIMTVDDIVKRGLGENLYSKKTPAERADELLAEDLRELEKSIADRTEWLVREVLFKGKINVVVPKDGIDVSVDFGFENKEVLSSELFWSAAASNPVKDLKEWRRTVIKQTGTAPNICIMGSESADAFMSNTAVTKAMDLRNMKNIVIEPRVVNPALTFLGRITEIDLDIYSYDEWFINDEEEEEPMIPYGHVLLANNGGIGSIEYGAVTQIESGSLNPVTYEAEIVPKQWVNINDNIKMIRLTSRPVPMPFDVSSWYVGVVLAEN